MSSPKTSTIAPGNDATTVPVSVTSPKQQIPSLLGMGLVKWLPETHENSNYTLLRIPIGISNSARGMKAISVAEGPLHLSLPLSPAAIAHLQNARLVRLPRPVRAKQLPIDYVALQFTYRRMLAERPFSTEAELAQHLAVSRVWVSRVLKGIKRKVG